MSKKNIYLSLILVVVFTFLFACTTLAEEVVIYGFAGNWDLWFTDWAKEFKSETGIEIQYLSGPAVQMYQKILSEKDNPKVDVILTQTALNYLLASKGLLEDMPWDEMSCSKNIDDKWKTENIAPWGYDLFMMGYNRDYVKKEDGPKKWIDLVDSKYKNKLMLYEPNCENAVKPWLIMREKYGEEKAWEYLIGMYKNVAKTANSPGDMENTMATGVAPIGVMCMGNVMVVNLQAGGNVQSVPPEEGAFLQLNTISIMKNCTNKDAAVKFINWFLSEHAQNDIMNDLGISISINNNVKLTNEDVREIGLAGHSVDEILETAYVPDWGYWTEGVEGDKTKLELLIDEIERKIKGLKN